MSIDKEKRDRERKIMAHNIAKQICDFSETYWEATQVLGDAKTIIETAILRKKPTVPETPVDRWGNKLEMPQVDAQGNSEIKGITVDLTN